MPNSELVQALVRGLDILQLISSNPEGMRLNEIVEKTGLKKPTVHNLLRTLAAKNFAVKTPLNRFAAGPALLTIVASQQQSQRTKRIEAGLLSLQNFFSDHIITLSTIIGGDVRCMKRLAPDNIGAIHHPAAQIFMPYTSVTAIALQAANPNYAVELETRYPFDEFGIGKWGTLEQFAKFKNETLQNGYCEQKFSDRYTIAFIMPDEFVLGLSTSGKIAKMDIYAAAAERFRNMVWKKDEN